MPVVLLNKPYRVLSQFTRDGDHETLASFVKARGVYPAGRLDFDSEGLLILTDEGALQARISQPRSGCNKTYWAQVEGEPSDDQLAKLCAGVTLKDGPAHALKAERMKAPPKLWPRDPPIRVRKNIVDSWIRIDLDAGRNRQVRRMTAAVDLPTLRLIRYAVGPFSLDDLAPGEARIVSNERAWQRLKQDSEPAS